MVLDGLLVLVAYGLMFTLRFDGMPVPPRFLAALPQFLALTALLHLASNWAWGLYGQMWRHASVQEARRVMLAGATSLLALLPLVVSSERLAPRSVVVLGALVTAGLHGAVRFHARLFAIRRSASRSHATRVAIVGGGDVGAAMVREMRRSHEAGLVPVVVVDDDPRKQGRALLGVPVAGDIASLGEVAQRYSADHVLLAVSSAPSSLVRRVARIADDAGLPLKVLPDMRELVGGMPSVRDLRDLEIGDLLGRRPVTIDLEGVRGFIRGRRILITGGGGSIGSEIARQIATLEPDALVLLDNDETHLFETCGEIPGCIEVLADVRDQAVIDRAIARYEPDTIFHAAAHKHVPILECHPGEAVRTNVLGTRNVVAAARAHDVGRVVLISTDKAVRPSSVMGASKWVCEQVVLSHRPPGGRYCAVRFGNVLGSRGSVIPRFIRQIERGGPVTVTDARMTRYFMSIREAVQLVLQASVLSEGGEIFVLEMGEPVRILDLAERMIRLSGRQVGAEVPIRIIGPRAGEKLVEELATGDELAVRRVHPDINALVVPVLDPLLLDREIEHLADLAAAGKDLMVAGRLLDLAGGGTQDVIHLGEATHLSRRR